MRYIIKHVMQVATQCDQIVKEEVKLHKFLQFTWKEIGVEALGSVSV